MKENKISIMSFYFQESPRPYLSMELKSTRQISIKVQYSFGIALEIHLKISQYIFIFTDTPIHASLLYHNTENTRILLDHGADLR